MRIFEAIGLGVLLAALVMVLLFVRRAVFGGGGGTIEVSVRLAARVPGRGWAPGFGRFAGDEFRWYRMFSFALRPRHVLSRLDLAIASRRPAEGPELLALPPGSRVLRCASTEYSVEIAMTEGALTGFLSWLEAGASGRYAGVMAPPEGPEPASADPARGEPGRTTGGAISLGSLRSPRADG